MVLTWILLGWPAVASGVWADDGINIRCLYRARRFPWSEIRRFESRPARSAIPWTDSNFRGIWLIPKHGKAIEVGFVCRPAGSRIDYIFPLRGAIVDPVTFRGKLAELDGLLSGHRRKVRIMGDVIERFVEVPDGYLYSRTQGQGQDVLLFNAGAADVRMWETTIPWLAQIARVTTFDYRDTGLSSRGTKPYSEIEDVAAVMDAAGANEAVLVGVSDGARRALAFAHRYPEKVLRVAVVGGTFGEFPEPSPEESTARVEMRELFARLARIRADDGMHAGAEVDIDAWGAALAPHDRRKMIGMQVANSYFVALEDHLGSELDPPVKTRFHEIATPISILVGGHDFEGTRLWAKRIESQAPDASLTVVPEADHFPMFSAPQQFEHFVREALRRSIH